MAFYKYNTNTPAFIYKKQNQQKPDYSSLQPPYSTATDKNKKKIWMALWELFMEHICKPSRKSSLIAY